MKAAHRLLATTSRQVGDTAEEAMAVVEVRLAVMGAAGATNNHHNTEEVTTTHLQTTTPPLRRTTASRASMGRVEVRHEFGFTPSIVFVYVYVNMGDRLAEFIFKFSKMCYLRIWR